MEQNQPYTSYRWLMLISVSLAIISCYIDMIAYAPILGEIAKDLKIEMGAATNLMMGFVVAVAFVLTWGGIVVDKKGVTFALVLGLLCASVPAAFMPMIGKSYGGVLFARLIQGASVGFIFGTLGPVLALWFPLAQQGLAGGLIIGSISVGSAIGVVSSPAIFSSTGSWQNTVAIMSIPGWLGIVLALAFTRRPPSAEVVKGLMEVMKSAVGQLSFGKALTLPGTWVATFVMICNAWGLYCLYNLVPAFLAAPSPMGAGKGPAQAGGLSLFLTIIGFFAMVVGGVFFDNIAKGKSRPAIAIGFVLTGFFTYLILSPSVSGSTGLLILCLLFAGWGIPFMNASISAYIAMNYPPNIIGSVIGWVFGFGTFGGALGLYLGGMSIGMTGSFFWAITMISIAAAVGLILSTFLKPRSQTTAAIQGSP